MRFHIVTLFPDFFQSPLACGLMDKAIRSGLVEVYVTDPRNYTTDRHRHLDDAPYGGGPGMVMQVEPLAACLRNIPTPGAMLCMTPRGHLADQELMKRLAREEDVTIVCGRYEGFDERLFTLFPMLMPLSIGDLVLNGGESAALAVMEAIARLVPGFMGKEASAEEESFSNNLLEYPQYTRPPRFERQEVPEVLLGGNHAEIAAWRRRQSLMDTLYYRRDLMDKVVLDREDAEILKGLGESAWNRFNQGFHVLLVGSKNARAARYAKKVFEPVQGAEGARDLLLSLKKSFSISSAYLAEDVARDLDRAALEKEGILVVSGIGEAAKDIRSRGMRRKPFVAGVSTFPKKDGTMPYPELSREIRAQPVLLVASVDGFLEKDVLKECNCTLRPARFLADERPSARDCFTMVLDRTLGDHLGPSTIFRMEPGDFDADRKKRKQQSRSGAKVRAMNAAGSGEGAATGAKRTDAAAQEPAARKTAAGKTAAGKTAAGKSSASKSDKGE